MRPSPLLPLLFSAFIVAAPVRAEDSPQRLDWKLDDTYTGAHADDFNRLRYEIPILMRQSEIDIAVATGLDFQEGWSHPLLVRFVDGSPPGVEHALAYVELLSDGKHQAQRLNINLDAYAKEKFNFDKVFRHELFHAMLNDALGPDAANVPRWLHEGFAVYAADQGEQLISSYLSQVETGDEEKFINGLEGPHGAEDYVEDYLAIKYIREVHGVNSVQGFTRALVANKGDVPAAIQASCFEDWETFQKNAREFSLSDLRRIKRTLRGTQAAPY
jgi:hypothetical protein